MKVHHLNGALMKPLIVGPMVAHVLLVEHPQGLVLADTGFGRADQREPSRIGPARAMLNPSYDDADTAAGAIEALGFATDDVTDIVLTHLDLDHAGGLSDFPGARVHTTADEHAAVFPKPKRRDSLRYRMRQFDHEIRWEIHRGPGDPWRDDLTGIEVLPGITMVPMHGHTKGHTAVAVEGAAGLLVHAGDALFDGSSITDHGPNGQQLQPIRMLRVFEQIIAEDRKRIAHNHAALRRLNDRSGVTVFSAHDKRMFDALRAT